jgi:hypothetical protein
MIMMKNIFVLAILLLAMNVFAQGQITNNKIELAVTAAGKALGQIAERKINKEGGNLVSTDGKVELKIPAGAVSKATTISILPISNLAPNGNARAYRLEPSGIKFNVPVQIVFHYKDDKEDANHHAFTGIAMQSGKGNWYSLKNIVLDTITKTISGDINHFSDWSTFEALKIMPNSSRLKVNKTIALEISHTGPVTNFEGGEDLSSLDDGMLAPLVKPKYMVIEKWTVNSVTSGNSNVGTITATGELDVNYKAPSAVPDKNPVAVEAHLGNLDFSIGAQKFNDLRISANILIYDNAYEVKMLASIKGGSNASWTGAVTYNDEGSFIVNMNKGKPEVEEIVNNLELITNNCEKIILNPTTNTGMIHIIGVKAIRAIPAQLPANPYATIEIYFIPGRVEITKFLLDCPPPPGVKERSKSGQQGVAQAFFMDMRTPLQPYIIKFLAKDEEQVIHQIGEEGGDMFVKFSVKPIKD